MTNYMQNFKHFVWVLMAQACYPSYSGGKDQEYDSSKPAQANSSARPYLKIPFKKRAGGKAQGVGPEFKLQYHKKKKRGNYGRDH
jgi:hypothetical protein